MDIFLNKYLELITPKELKDIDDVREINIYVTNEEYYHQRILTIINYFGHIKIVEYYESPLGTVYLEKIFHNIKPSDIIRMYFPRLPRG